MVELPGEDTVKDVLHEASKQGGPIAVLAVMLVAAMLVGIGAVGYILVPVMSDYITASARTLDDNAKSFSELSASMTAVHTAHASMMQATQVTQEAVADNGEKISELQTVVLQMSEIVSEAKMMMKDVPNQRLQHHQEQLKKLDSIDASIQQLLLAIENGQT